MFEAFVVVCAVSANLEIDQNNCMFLYDEWGPYNTEENCMIRTDQMVDETLNSEMNFYISKLLGYPIFLHAQSYCMYPTGKPV